MAMRTRGGRAAPPNRGGRSGGVRPVFEDFRPISEWHQDQESHILTIYLPGFMKEQIRVSTEGENTIRVRGERLVAGNKWSHFLQDFKVPEDAEMNSIRARFQGGMLNITVPKKNVSGATTKARDHVVKQPTPQEGQDKAIGTTDEKSFLEPKKVLGGVVDDVPSETKMGLLGQQEAVERKLEAKHDVSETQDKKSLVRSEDEETSKMKLKKDGQEKEFKGKETIQTFANGGVGLKDVVKELNEERKMLVNMGVAILVIMGLSAYVTYNFASGKHPN